MKKLLWCLCLFSCAACSPTVKKDVETNPEPGNQPAAEAREQNESNDSAGVQKEQNEQKNDENTEDGSAKAVDDSADKAVQEDNQMAKDDFGFEMDSFKTASGRDISFHAIKHGSIRIQFDGLEFEVDPVTRLGENVTEYTRLPDADYILVTHEHQDHFDPEAISALQKPSSVLITNAVCASKLGSGDVMGNGDKRQLRDNIAIEAVPAYNTTPDREKFHPKGRDNGFVLSLDGFRIYIAGDTEDYDDMAQIKDIDVAFFPCNQPYTMTPKQLARAVDMVKPKVVFPYHYGETSMDEVRALLKDSPVDLRIRSYQ